MQLITLTSDYGQNDYRIPVIKGKILSEDSGITLCDISHTIPPFDLAHTAFILRACLQEYPKGSVHTVWVDSFYNVRTKYLAASYNERWILTRDNGLLGLIYTEIRPDSVFEITLNNRFDDVTNATNQNILIPSAVHLAKGGLPEIIGRPAESYRELTNPNQVVHENSITGQILYIDHFGNLVTNISKQMIQKKMAVYPNFQFKVRRHEFKTIYDRYSGIIENKDSQNSYHGCLIAYYNTQDLLEIGIYKGYKGNGAKELMGMKIRDIIRIDFE